MSEVEEISNLVVGALHQPTRIDIGDGRVFIALPSHGGGYTLEQVTLTNKADVLMPKVVSQYVKMQTGGSLMDYINRFKNTDTVLFADIDNDTIVSIIDYHIEPDPNGDKSPKATLGVHRATLKLPKSLEWQTWTKASGQLMSHVKFATFLEENSIDVVSPVGADLLELCRDLQAKGDYSFSSAVRMGDVTALEYAKKSDATTKGGMTMPTSIVLSIPVYFGESNVNIVAFMRRKIEDGALYLGFELSRAENIRQNEFHRIVDAVKAGVGGLTTVYGTPA